MHIVAYMNVYYMNIAHRKSIRAAPEAPPAWPKAAPEWTSSPLAPDMANILHQALYDPIYR